MSRPAFPLTIRNGSVVVKIYRNTRPGDDRGRAPRTVYQLSWHVAGVRHLKQFADLADAKAEAKLKAEALSAGRSQAAKALAMDDVALLHELRRVAGNTPPLAALEEWAHAKRLCGDHLLAAAQAWANSRRATKSATVAEAVEAFLTAKDRAGIDTRSSYRKILPKLSETMGTAPISTVTASALVDWAHETFAQGDSEIAHPGTFNTVRKRLVALWNWAQLQGLLPDVATTEADKIELMREGAQPIGILTVQDYARLLVHIRDTQPAHLATAVLAGFAGLRRAELHAQRWEDIQLERALLRVSAAKRNTVSYRLVHLSPAAVEWLMLCKRDGELVSPPWGLDLVRRFAREAGIPCPENGFRHSFISYRCAATGNVAETAQEAGNSPDVVHKHYRELVAKDEGKLWFNLSPKQAAEFGAMAGKVVRLA